MDGSPFWFQFFFGVPYWSAVLPQIAYKKPAAWSALSKRSRSGGRFFVGIIAAAENRDGAFWRALWGIL